MSYYRSVLFIGLLAASVFVVCSVEPRTLHAEAINLSHQNERPLTIPAIREWRSTAGWFLLNSNSRIVVSSSAPSELKDTAKLFAGELRSISGKAVARIVQQNPIPREGDILLAIDPENQTLGDEGYNISIGPYIAVRAPKSAGVFYGTRTVLQIIRQSASGKGMPKGDIRDLSFPKIISLRIGAMRQNHRMIPQCLPSSICLGSLSSTCSGRADGLKSRISSCDISSILP
jgi:hexosaminidase